MITPTLLAALAVLLIGQSTAQAQDADAVFSRLRAKYDAIGAWRVV